MKAAVKAGKLSNGLENDKGKVVHFVEDLGMNTRSLCGTRPANQWSERELLEVNCEKCIKKLRQQLTIKAFVNQIDGMVGDE